MNDATRKSNLRRWLPTMILVLGLFVAGFWLFRATGENITYYYEIDEVDREAIGDRMIKISGLVGDEIRRDPGAMKTWFPVTSATQTIPVEYTGTVPDIFRPGIQVVVRGRFEDDAFIADDLLAKCPSKYATSDNPDDFKHLGGHPAGIPYGQAVSGAAVATPVR